MCYYIITNWIKSEKGSVKLNLSLSLKAILQSTLFSLCMQQKQL